MLLFSAPCYRVLSILPGATNFGCVLPRTVLSLGGAGRPATAGYRVLLFCGLCYRVLLFSAAFGLSATACYRVLSRSLPRATAFATACYRVCYRVLPGAIACYNCKCDRRPICGAKRESRGRARSAGRVRADREFRIRKKKLKKNLCFSLIRLASSKSCREWGTCFCMLNHTWRHWERRMHQSRGLKSLFKTNKWLLLLQLQQAASSYKTRAPSSPRWIFGCRRG